MYATRYNTLSNTLVPNLVTISAYYWKKSFEQTHVRNMRHLRRGEDRRAELDKLIMSTSSLRCAVNVLARARLPKVSCRKSYDSKMVALTMTMMIVDKLKRLEEGIWHNVCVVTKYYVGGPDIVRRHCSKKTRWCSRILENFVGPPLGRRVKIGGQTVKPDTTDSLSIVQYKYKTCENNSKTLCQRAIKELSHVLYTCSSTSFSWFLDDVDTVHLVSKG